MFYWNQKELLNVVSHRCMELAAWCRAVTTVKSWNEGSGSMEGNVHFSVERWTGAQHTGDGHRACPNQPHISSKSHLLDRGFLTQSLRVPEEPADSFSTRPCCIQPQQQMLRAPFECGCYASTSALHPWRASLLSWKKHECFERFGQRRCEMVAEKFMFGSLSCHRTH